MRSRTIPAVLAVIVLVGGLALINYSANHNSGAASNNPPPPPPAKTAANSTPPPSGAPAGPSEGLTTEATIGNPQAAKTRVTLGFTVDESVAEHEDVAEAAINSAIAWAKAHPSASLQVVCVDIPISDRQDPSTGSIPVGITINGAPVPGANKNIGPGGLQAADIDRTLSAAAH